MKIEDVNLKMLSVICKNFISAFAKANDCHTELFEVFLSVEKKRKREKEKKRKREKEKRENRIYKRDFKNRVLLYFRVLLYCE